jgi:hypothetical protein
MELSQENTAQQPHTSISSKEGKLATVGAPVSSPSPSSPRVTDRRFKKPESRSGRSEVLQTGPYLGVVPANGRFISKIRYRGGWRVLGSFDSSVEAAAAHDEMAIRLSSGVYSRGTAARDGALTNFDAFDGPVSRFGYGLVQAQSLHSRGPILAFERHWCDDISFSAVTGSKKSKAA